MAPTFPFPVHERVHATARHIRVTVSASGDVRLTIPRHVSKAEARAFLASRVDWVLETLAKARAAAGGRLQYALNWDDRDQLPYLGVATPVLFSPARLARPATRFQPEAITLFAAADSSPLQRTRALKAAFIKEARIECEDVLLREAARLAVQFGSLRIADTRSQWGSCTRQGDISLSWRLLMAPPEVLRYVAVHELCHIHHPDHSPAFWKLLARQMPGFESQQAWLKSQGGGLHRWLKTGAEVEEPQPDLFEQL